MAPPVGDWGPTCVGARAGPDYFLPSLAADPEDDPIQYPTTPVVRVPRIATRFDAIPSEPGGSGTHKATMTTAINPTTVAMDTTIAPHIRTAGDMPDGGRASVLSLTARVT